MPIAALCGLPHSESEVYYVKVSAIGLAPYRYNLFCHFTCAQVLTPRGLE